MNKIDQEIVRFLELRDFENTKRIANNVGLSERTVRRHLDRMIERGAARVVAIPNPVLCNIRAWSKIGIKVNPGQLSRVARVLVAHPAVYFVAYSLGRFDIIIAVHFDTTDKLAYFVNSELAAIEGVVNSETWILAFPRKYYGFSWPAPSSPRTVVIGDHDRAVKGQENYQIDNIDRSIISMLREDGLLRPGMIESKLGLSKSTIRKHIRHMLDNRVYIRQVVLEPRMLENDVWATIGITINGRDVHVVLDNILRYPSVYLASVSLGRFNAVIAVRFHNMDLLNRFVTAELPSMEGVSSTETFVHNKPLKYHNIPFLAPLDVAPDEAFARQ